MLKSQSRASQSYALLLLQLPSSVAPVVACDHCGVPVKLDNWVRFDDTPVANAVSATRVLDTKQFCFGSTVGVRFVLTNMVLLARAICNSQAVIFKVIEPHIL